LNELSCKPERIQKILSACGVASRREAERMISAGRIYINGIRATIGQSATIGVDNISVDDIPLSGKKKFVYLMLNKPCGYLTTVKDARGRKTVMELIAGAGSRVYPVRRLDLDSEGLLLFTNDGDFANSIMHPSFGKLKTYEVEVSGDVHNAVKQLQEPVKIDEFTVRAHSAELLKTSDDRDILQISVNEGRNRQIRKMCAVCGLKVISLKRISLGSLKLGDLKSGQWRFLTKEEVKALGKGHIASN